MSERMTRLIGYTFTLQSEKILCQWNKVSHKVTPFIRREEKNSVTRETTQFDKSNGNSEVW